MGKSIEGKIRQLNLQRRGLLARGQKVQAGLDKEFRKALRGNKDPLPAFVQSWNGRYNALLGPIVKQIRTIDTVIAAIK